MLFIVKYSPLADNMGSMADTGVIQGNTQAPGAGDQPRSSHGGSNEDMKKVLFELDNTGYFNEVKLNNLSKIIYAIFVFATYLNYS